jgi:putative membrane protein
MLRSCFGGILMGLANLVPGVSGGTMLVATGVYGRFVDAVAQVTTFRFRRRSMAVLAIIVACALLTIVVGAGTMRNLVIDHRWVMYSLFIGFTLGGVPLLWSMVRPANTAAVLGIVSGLIAMIVLATLESEQASTAAQQGSLIMLVITGIAAGSAMVLPGVSGMYLVLVLGQYVVILDAVDGIRQGHMDTLLSVVIPVGIGVVIGVVLISNIVSRLLVRARHATLGVLLGLLVGAVFGLWPFRATRAPVVGDIIRGQLVETESQAEAIKPSRWPMESFEPGFGMIVAAIAIAILGFTVSLLITRMGRDERI